jgi:predicted dehydrogenase
MLNEKEVSRRSFLEQSAVAAAGAGLATACATAQTGLESVALAPDEKLRVGILGCGNRSTTHIEGINQHPRMEVVAMCDILPEMMDEKKALLEGPAPRLFTDYEQMLKEADMHAVVNVLPNTLHKAGTIASMQAGFHVLCEKPLSLLVTECRDMIAASEKYRKVLQVGTQSRYTPNNAAIAEKVHSGLIGNVLYAWLHVFRADWRKLHPDPVEDARINWRMQQDQCGGIIFEQGIHQLDYFNWFINSEPEEITCMGGINNTRLEKRNSWDHIGLVVRYANNALMTCGGNLYGCGGTGEDCLFGDKGTLEIRGRGNGGAILHTRTYWRPYGMGEDPIKKSDKVKLSDKKGNASYLQYDGFMDAVEGKAPPFPSGRDHVAAVQIARGAMLAMEAGGHIKASEVD